MLRAPANCFSFSCPSSSLYYPITLSPHTHLVSSEVLVRADSLVALEAVRRGDSRLVLGPTPHALSQLRLLLLGRRHALHLLLLTPHSLAHLLQHQRGAVLARLHFTGLPLAYRLHRLLRRHGLDGRGGADRLPAKSLASSGLLRLTLQESANLLLRRERVREGRLALQGSGRLRAQIDNERALGFPGFPGFLGFNHGSHLRRSGLGLLHHGFARFFRRRVASLHRRRGIQVEFLLDEFRQVQLIPTQ